MKYIFNYLFKLKRCVFNHIIKHCWVHTKIGRYVYLSEISFKYQFNVYIYIQIFFLIVYHGQAMYFNISIRMQINYY